MRRSFFVIYLVFCNILITPAMDAPEQQQKIEQQLKAERATEAFLDILHKAFYENTLVASQNQIKQILDDGADPGCIMRNNVLRDAFEQGRKDLLQLLLDLGANVNHKDEHGLTLMRRWVCSHTNNNVEIAKIFLAAGADIEWETLNGRSNLLDVAIYNGPEKVQFLLNQGIDPNRNLPLHVHAAISTKHPEILKLLLEAGADFYQNDEIKEVFKKYKVIVKLPTESKPQKLL